MVSERRPISDLLRAKIKLSNTPAYVLARVAGVNRTTLSCWMNRIANPANHDAVVELGRILGVPASDCFEAPPSPPSGGASASMPRSGEAGRSSGWPSREPTPRKRSSSRCHRCPEPTRPARDARLAQIDR